MGGVHGGSREPSAVQRWKRGKDLMLSLYKTTDQLAMANSVHCYGHGLRREDSHVLRRA